MTAWPGERALHGGADPIPLPAAAGPGRLWLCGKHFVAPDPDAALARTGTTTVICLCELGELSSRYPDYVDWLRSSQPSRALWFPVADLSVPAADHRDELLGELQRRLRTGERLLMHCGAGLGRAGTLAVALLITAGVELGEAAARVAGQRPMAGPQSPVQSDFLVELATDTARQAAPSTDRLPGLP